MIDLIEVNDRILGEVDDLLSGSLLDQYTSPCREVFSSSIGQHIRHFLEHYEEFLRAVGEERTLNYENRPRDSRVETDPGVARLRIQEVRSAIGELRISREAMVVNDHGSGTKAASSIERELQFLISHTVHHLALVAVIANAVGLTVPDGFGVAPTTLKFRESV